MPGVRDRRGRPKPAAVQGRAGGSKDTGRDVHALWLEEEPPGHRRQPVLHGGVLGRREKAVDPQAGRGGDEPFREGEGAGLRLLQAGVLQLGHRARAVRAVHLGSVHEGGHPEKRRPLHDKRPLPRAVDRLQWAPGDLRAHGRKPEGAKVYELRPSPESGAASQEAPEGLTAGQMGILEKELERTGISMEAVLDRYRIAEAWQMTPEIYKKALGSLKRTKPKEAA